MKLFFYASEQQFSSNFFDEVSEGYFVFNNSNGQFADENNKARVLGEVKNARVMFFPEEVKDIVLKWFEGEFERKPTTDFLPEEGDDSVDNFLEKNKITEGYEVIKKKPISDVEPESPELPESEQPIDTGSFTLTGQLELFVSGLMRLLEPVYLASFVSVAVTVTVMGGLKSDEADTYQKIEKHLQQGQVEQAKKEINNKKIEDGVDKRRLLVAIHEATAAKDSPTTLDPPTESPNKPPVVDIIPDTTTQCFYHVRNGDTANEVSKKFYETANHFAEIWAASIRTSSQGVMEIQRMQKAADGKKNYVAYVTVGNSIQPGYILVIPNPSNRKECVTDLQVLIQMP